MGLGSGVGAFDPRLAVACDQVAHRAGPSYSSGPLAAGRLTSMGRHPKPQGGPFQEL